MLEAEQLYKAWAKDQPPKSTAEPSVEADDADVPVSLTAEKAEGTAWGEIKAYLGSMDPYEFQQLVAGLLRGMGYYVTFVAPPGKDRGIDIIAQTDALGATGPRVKVQVKREQSKTDAKSLRAFMSVLKDQDVGAFINLGGFTSDAADEARTEARRITLFDASKLFDLWIRHYETIPEEDRRRLPIKRVNFLAQDALES
jgi:restriction system protein